MSTHKITQNLNYCGIRLYISNLGSTGPLMSCQQSQTSHWSEPASPDFSLVSASNPRLLIGQSLQVKTSHWSEPAGPDFSLVRACNPRLLIGQSLQAPADTGLPMMEEHLKVIGRLTTFTQVCD